MVLLIAFSALTGAKFTIRTGSKFMNPQLLRNSALSLTIPWHTHGTLDRNKRLDQEGGTSFLG